MVITRVAVEMPAYHSVWARSNKRYENEDVNLERMSTTVATKRNTMVSKSIACVAKMASIIPFSVSAFSVAANRKNDPIFIDSVARVTWNLAKTCWDSRILVRHAFAPLQHWFVEKSVAVLKAARASFL